MEKNTSAPPRQFVRGIDLDPRRALRIHWLKMKGEFA
jgi:hypothetical protein